MGASSEIVPVGRGLLVESLPSRGAVTCIPGLVQLIEHTAFGVRTAVLTLAIVGPRRALPHRLTVDDEISLEQYEATPGGFAEALADARDLGLCQELVRLAEGLAPGERTIGVCWGATHMRAGHGHAA